MKLYFLCLVLLSTFFTLPRLTHSFPLRYVGHIKNGSVPREKREPVLCWVVQIRTGLRCESPVLEDAENGHQVARTCKVESYSTQHVKEIARELNLVIVHTFSRFPDHVLMCFVEERLKEKVDGKTLSLSSIHTLHPGVLKPENKSDFFHRKSDVESQLTSHEEIISFHSEFTHQRKSRLDIKPHSINQDGKHDKNHTPSSTARNKSHRKHQLLKFGSSKLLKYYSQIEHRNVGNTADGARDLDLELLQLYKNCVSQYKSFIRKFCHQSRIPYQAHKLCHILTRSDFNTRRINNDININAFIRKLYSKHPSTQNHFIGTDRNATYDPSEYLNLICCTSSMLSSIDKDVNKSTNMCHQPFHPVIDNIENKCNETFRREDRIHINATNTSAIIIDKNLLSFTCLLLNLCRSNHTASLSCHTIVTHILCNDVSFAAEYLCKSRKSLTGQMNLNVRKIIRNLCNFTLKERANGDANFNSDNINDENSYIQQFKQREKRSLSSSSSSSYQDKRKKRSSSVPAISFNDPAFPRQWHLQNRVTPSMDLNVTGVWVKGYNGSGVTVAVVDDGLQWQNPDLEANYEYRGSWDFNDDDPDPTPSTLKAANHHGTRCAGEIAAVANNHECGVGVAYGAKVAGIRVLDGVMTDSLEAEAFNRGMEINDIYSCSWGPDDDGKTVDGPHIMAARAMKHGVEFGRHGYGSIFVVASGNGGVHKDNCNFDGYANSIYTVTIGAVDEGGAMPYYAEECASMLGVTFSSGTNNKRDIVTTDWTHHNPTGCTERHTGTSAAAPLAAGMIALILQARPCLTWRDVQYIIILTAKKVDVDIAHWQENGAGLSHSHKHGFGLLSSWRMVNAARVWKPVPWMTSYSRTSDLAGSGLDIPKGGVKRSLVVSLEVGDEDIQGYSLFTLESVQVTIWLKHPCRGNLSIELTSPSNTVSVIAAPRPNDNSSSGFQDWSFTTVRCWGESPVGNWTLVISDMDTLKFGNGKLIKWRLTIFGTPMSRSEFDERRNLVESAMSGEYLDSNHTLSCPPPPKKTETVAVFSEKTLKIVILCGVFCLIMAIYETFEYMCCYNDEKEERKQEVEKAVRARRLTERTIRGLENEYSLLPVTADSETNSITRSVGNGYNDLTRNLNRNSNNHSVVAENGINNDVGDDNDDDDDEDDIFDASETCKLLNDSQSSFPRSSSRAPGSSRNQNLDASPSAVARVTMFPSLDRNSHSSSNSTSSPHANPDLCPEVIQLSTFKAASDNDPGDEF